MIDKTKGKIRWVRSTDLLVGLTLFFVSLLFFYDLLGERCILTERDLGAYFIPPRFFWVESIRNGEFPLWNSYQFSGHPFFANPQYAVLYPINILFFILPFDVAFNLIIIFHFFLAGLFVYLLLKDMNVSSTGSLLSGLISMLSGYLLSVHSLLTILLSIVWTPLVMLFFRRAMTSPGIRNEILTAIFITLSFLGGGIEIVYGNFFVLLSMLIFSPLNNPSPPSFRQEGMKGRLKAISTRLKSLFVICIIFLLLSAVQLIPFLELFHHSIRGQGVSYQEATVWSFAPRDILLFFLPDAYGYFLDMKKYWINQCWFKTLYTGGLPFILSLIFFLLPRPLLSPKGEKDGMRGFGDGRRLYLSLILFSVFLSLGRYNPLYPYVFNYLPFFNGIRYPVKFLYIFIIVLSITAGLGFQRLTEFSNLGDNKKFKNGLIVFSLASGLFLLFLVINHKGVEQFLKIRGVDFPDFNYLPVNLYNAKRFLFYLTFFLLLLRIGDGVKWVGWTKFLLVFFLAADLFGNMGFYGKENSFEYFKNTKTVETISSDKGHFRTFTTAKTIALDTPVLIGEASPLDGLKEKHVPSLDSIHRLHNIWGIDVIRLKRTDDLYKAFTNTPSISTTNLLDLYGVKYIISVTPIGEDPRFELIYSRLEGLKGKREDLIKENTIKLYRVRNHFPRAWFVKDFRVLEDRAVLSRMLTKEFHPDREVLLEEEPPYIIPTHKGGRDASLALPAGSQAVGRGEGEVEFISESNNRLHLRVRTKENALLVLSDTYDPGWKAFVDGKERKILRANYNFRAIPVEAGKHEVRFIYDPASFKTGTLISLLTLIGIVVYFVKRRRHRIQVNGSCLNFEVQS